MTETFQTIHEKITNIMHNGGGECEFSRENFTTVCRIAGNLTYFDIDLSNISIEADGDTVFVKIQLKGVDVYE